jgi:hypothetical protein
MEYFGLVDFELVDFMVEQSSQLNELSFQFMKHIKIKVYHRATACQQKLFSFFQSGH